MFIGELESEISSTSSSLGVVLLHPYGPLGGNMQNNVVDAFFSYFKSINLTVLRYNMRGVGKSFGSTSWTGKDQVEDLINICEYVLSIPNAPKSLLVVGYSYGSLIASAAAASIRNLVGLVAVSFPYSVIFALTAFNTSWYIDKLKTISQPKLFIMGRNDNFSFLGSYKSFIEKLASTSSVILEDVDHFWFGNEELAVKEIRRFIEQNRLVA